MESCTFIDQNPAQNLSNFASWLASWVVFESQDKTDANIFQNLSYSILKSVYPYIFLAVVFLSLILAFFVVYKSYWKPVLFVKEITEIGFGHIPPGPYRSLRIARAQNARRFGKKLPPPYPNGWFAVAESRELRIGGVVPVDALGLHLCVYRGEDGKVRCVDAYCPHLGANMAVGGTVCGDAIRCPFHHWTFGENGACVSIPGEINGQIYPAVPKGLSIRSWTVLEADGAVWIWYDAEGRPPLWTIEDAPELKSWGYRGRNEFYVNVHIQDIPENGADVAHLNTIHSSSLGEKYPFLAKFVGEHIWSAVWTKGKGHTAKMTFQQDYKIGKFTVFHVDGFYTQIGPSHLRLLLNLPVGPILTCLSVTPIGPMLQKVVHRVYTPAYNAPLAAAYMRWEADMFERDIAVWNSKQYVSTPAYLRSDKGIRDFRAWFSQFYSERSTSFRESLQNPIEW